MSREIVVTSGTHEGRYHIQARSGPDYVTVVTDAPADGEYKVGTRVRFPSELVSVIPNAEIREVDA